MDKLSDKLRDRLGRTFAGSATSAFAALLMVGAIALGSTVIRPMTADRFNDAATAQADDPAGHDGGTVEGPGEEPGDKPQDDGAAPGWETAGNDGASGTDSGTCQDEQGNAIACDGDVAHDPFDQPKDEPPAEEPKDEPKDEPAPPAPSTHLTLAAVFNADYGKIVVEWSAYGGSFDKYKLVRSTDGNPTWPLGDGDELVGVVGADGETRFVDKYAPCNTEVQYRAFAVRHTESGYQVLASSNAGSATRVCDEQPPAEPSAMGFEVMQTADGVLLSWEACGSEAFVAYKVVRSATNPSPMYPLNEGSELIGVVGDAGQTTFVDANVAPGQTWTYRVLSMGQDGGGWYVLGLTDALSLTVE